MDGSGAELAYKKQTTDVANYSNTLEIPKITGGSRTVTFQYRFRGSWINIDTRSQAAIVYSQTGSYWQCFDWCRSRSGLITEGSLDVVRSWNWIGWSFGEYWTDRDVNIKPLCYRYLSDGTLEKTSSDDRTEIKYCRCRNAS